MELCRTPSVARILNRVGFFVRRHARDRWMSSESIHRMCRPTETSHRLLTDSKTEEPRGFITLDLRIQCEIFVSFVECQPRRPLCVILSQTEKTRMFAYSCNSRSVSHGENETNYSSCKPEMLPLKCKFNYIYQTETVGSAQSVNSFTDVNAEISLTGNIQRLAVHRVQKSYSQRSHVNSLKLFCCCCCCFH